MSRGQDFARFTSGLGAALEVDIGAVDDEPCAVGPCDSEAVFRVPWPSVGGDVAFCSFHLARYRARHPDLWERVQNAVGDDLSAHATRGNRFLTFDEIPQQLFDGEFEAIALLATGEALFEEIDPDQEVSYRTVDRRLEETDRITLSLENAGEFLEWISQERGVHHWNEDVEDALLGEVSA